jgi:hypothetical protein
MSIPYLLVGPRGIQHLFLGFGEGTFKGYVVNLMDQGWGTWVQAPVPFSLPSLQLFLQGLSLPAISFDPAQSGIGWGRKTFSDPKPETLWALSVNCLSIKRVD